MGERGNNLEIECPKQEKALLRRETALRLMGARDRRAKAFADMANGRKRGNWLAATIDYSIDSQRPNVFCCLHSLSLSLRTEFRAHLTANRRTRLTLTRFRRTWRRSYGGWGRPTVHRDDDQQEAAARASGCPCLRVNLFKHVLRCSFGWMDRWVCKVFVHCCQQPSLFSLSFNTFVLSILSFFVYPVLFLTRRTASVCQSTFLKRTPK